MTATQRSIVSIGLSVFIIVATLVICSLSPVSMGATVGIFIVELVGAIAACTLYTTEAFCELEKKFGELKDKD